MNFRGPGRNWQSIFTLLFQNLSTKLTEIFRLLQHRQPAENNIVAQLFSFGTIIIEQLKSLMARLQHRLGKYPMLQPGRYFSTDTIFSPNGMLLMLAAIKIAVHFATNSNYGFHRDELFYLALGEHPAWGYDEVPPSIAWLGQQIRDVAGESLFAIRLLPALIGAAVVVLTGLIAREIGQGGRFAEVFSASCVLVGPVFLRTHTFFDPIVFDQFYWCLGTLLLIKAVKNPDRWYLWLLIGGVAGLGLLNKYTMLLWGLGVFIGLLMTSNRNFLYLTPWPWLAALVAFLIVLPNFMWQHENAWPAIEHFTRQNTINLHRLSRLDFILGQIAILHPITLPVWVSGIWYLLSKKAARPYRILLWLVATILFSLLLINSKPYYLTPVYPILFAAGAIHLERFIRAKVHHWLKPLIVMLVVQAGILLSPYGLPVLPAENMAQFMSLAAEYGRLTQPLENEFGKPEKLPPDFANMFGWPEQVAAVQTVYDSLNNEDKAGCVVLAGNYGEAAALDFFGSDSLPPVISYHGSYYRWGPGEEPGTTVIAIGVPLDMLRQYFRRIRRRAVIEHPHAISYETDLPVYVCQRPAETLQELWPQWEDLR